MLGTLTRRWSRRELFRRSALLALPGLLRGSPAAAATPSAAPAAADGLRAGQDIYQSIGVRPLIHARGTFTLLSGSRMLPEVRAAMDAAAQHHVHLDELMAAIGARLAELTKAEWGMVSSGCSAALTHATAACIAGGNPDLHVRIPNLAGFPKDEVIIPATSRNVYDAAIRAVGVRLIEVDTPEALQLAIGPKTAMIYIFAGPRYDSGPMSTEAICRVAKAHSVPVLVDAAAEGLTIPNVHLQRGATLVGYSGGKCIRGPQCAGLLLGRKDLVRAAWVSSAPHHGHGRTMKLGKEEAMGMLAAVEMWVKRDHKAEMQTWISWLNNIAGRVSKIDGVKTAVREPRGLSNHSPGLSISWDPAKLGITGEEVSNILYTTEPRIALGGGGSGGGGRGGRGAGETSISITAYMMAPGEDKIVGDRIFQILSAQRPPWKPEAPKTPSGDLTGRWDVHIEFAAGSSDHTFHVKQQGNQLVGTH